MQAAVGPISVCQFDVPGYDIPQGPDSPPLAVPLGASFEDNRYEKKHGLSEMGGWRLFVVHDARRKRWKFCERGKSRRREEAEGLRAFMSHEEE